MSLETIRRAILLGRTRKSLALLDQPRAQPIRSLYYFQALLQEVVAETYLRSYWQHLRDQLERCEQRSAQAERSAAPQPACPNLTPADPLHQATAMQAVVLSANLTTSAPQLMTFEARSRGLQAPCVRFADGVAPHHETLGSG